MDDLRMVFFDSIGSSSDLGEVGGDIQFDPLIREPGCRVDGPQVFEVAGPVTDLLLALATGCRQGRLAGYVEFAPLDAAA